MLILLLYRVSQLDSLDNELLAAITKFLVLAFECLTDLEQIKAFLLPDGSNGRIVTLKHLKLKLHLLHLLYNLLSLDLLLDQFALEMANFSLLAILCIVDLIREVLCNALKLLALLILLSKHVDKLVCVDVLVHLKFLDLVL